MQPVNLIAVFVAGIIPMVVGSIWYGPLFGKAWMHLVGMTPDQINEGKKDMPKIYGLMFIASLITAFVLAQFVAFSGASTYVSGALIGFWAWLGFIATSMFTQVLFVKKPMKLYKIDVGYHLVSLVLMGALLAIWT